MRDDERGVIVTDVDLSGPAYGRIGPLFVITNVLHPQEKRIRTAKDLESVLSAARSGDIVSLLTYDLRDPQKSTRVVNLRVGGSGAGRGMRDARCGCRVGMARRKSASATNGGVSCCSLLVSTASK
ncbi:MAG: hypothetical protein ACR2HZ_12690 [Gemmatimonadaceae bacterium]